MAAGQLIHEWKTRKNLRLFSVHARVAAAEKESTSQLSNTSRRYLPLELMTLDSKEVCIRRNDKCIAKAANPQFRGTFQYRSYCFHPELNVHLVASSDATILVLAPTLQAVGIIPMGKFAVQQLAYIKSLGEVLAAGSLGLRAFRLIGQQMGPQQKMQTLERRWILQLTRIYDCAAWVSSFQYHPLIDIIVVCWPHTSSVEMFETAKRNRAVLLRGCLHEQPVTDSVLFPNSYYVITGCQAGAIKIWYGLLHDTNVDPETTASGDRCDDQTGETATNCDCKAKSAPTKLSHLYTFPGHHGAVTKLELNPARNKTFVSSSLDGSACIWNIETLELIMAFDAPSKRPLLDLHLTDDFITVADDRGNIFVFTDMHENVELKYSHGESIQRDLDEGENGYMTGDECDETDCVDLETLYSAVLSPAPALHIAQGQTALTVGPPTQASLLRARIRSRKEHSSSTFPTRTRKVATCTRTDSNDKQTVACTADLCHTVLPTDAAMLPIRVRCSNQKIPNLGVSTYDFAVHYTNRLIGCCTQRTLPLVAESCRTQASRKVYNNVDQGPKQKHGRHAHEVETPREDDEDYNFRNKSLGVSAVVKSQAMPDMIAQNLEFPRPNPHHTHRVQPPHGVRVHLERAHCRKRAWRTRPQVSP